MGAFCAVENLKLRTYNLEIRLLSYFWLLFLFLGPEGPKWLRSLHMPTWEQTTLGEKRAIRLLFFFWAIRLLFFLAGKVPRKPSCEAKWIVGPCYEGKMNREAQSQPLLECKAQAWSSKISKSTPVPKQLFLNRKSLHFLIETAPACGGVLGNNIMLPLSNKIHVCRKNCWITVCLWYGGL